jgi:hypothetical protein
MKTKILAIPIKKRRWFVNNELPPEKAAELVGLSDNFLAAEIVSLPTKTMGILLILPTKAAVSIQSNTAAQSYRDEECSVYRSYRNRRQTLWYYKKVTDSYMLLLKAAVILILPTKTTMSMQRNSAGTKLRRWQFFRSYRGRRWTFINLH